jgi:hypothetical protein
VEKMIECIVLGVILHDVSSSIDRYYSGFFPKIFVQNKKIEGKKAESCPNQDNNVSS